MKKKLLSLLAILALAFTFAFVPTNDNVYAASKAKKYYLPKEVRVYYYETDEYSSLSKAKYDKYGNLTSAIISEMIPMKFNIKYKNKKGVISKVTYGDGDALSEKFYDKKGRLTKIKIGADTYKYKLDKKGLIKKATLNGDLDYKVKSIKLKNGFLSKVVYGNGNVNNYNADGVMTSAVTKDGTKYTYKYTKKSGKIIKILVKRDGKNYKKINLKYGKASTKDVWKFSCLMNYLDGPSNACELYPNSPLSGVNRLNYNY